MLLIAQGKAGSHSRAGQLFQFLVGLGVGVHAATVQQHPVPPDEVFKHVEEAVHRELHPNKHSS